MKPSQGAGLAGRRPVAERNSWGFWPIAIAIMGALLATGTAAAADVRDSEVDRAVTGGLDWLVAHQSKMGGWTANGGGSEANGGYPTTMSALAGVALLCEGSTTTQGKYAANIRKAVDYLVSRSHRKTGLIGDPSRTTRYTYGHGFAMLFLSQVLGEEEDADRRQAVGRRARPGRSSSPARHRPRPAAGATSAPKMVTASTKARPPSPRCKVCAAAATPASPFPRKSSTRRSTTSAVHAARWRRAVQFQGWRRPPGHLGGRHRLPVQRRRLRQTNTCPSC